MVQDNLEATCGVPFMHPFFCNLLISEKDVENKIIPEDIKMEMTVDINENLYTFKRGVGLIEAFQPDGRIAILWAMNNPCNLGKGTHSFNITAQTKDGIVILNQSGKIKVVGDVNKIPSSDINWFDSFEPRELVAESQKGIDLPLEPGADLKIVDERMSICNDCPFFELESGTCMQCGCFMPIKTTLLHSQCPVGKW